MTTLRDDGMLETDDPVVAACFLGKLVHYLLWDTKETSRGLYQVREISVNGWNCYDYPILIPAKTAAEVWAASDVAANVMTLAILKLPWTGHDIPDWLRKHADPGA